MLLRRIHDDSLSQAAYLVGCPASREAIVFDCARDVDRALKVAEQAGLRIVAAADTHVHADFVSGLRALVERHGVHGYLSRVGAAPAWVDACPGRTTAVGDGDELRVGGVRVRVLHTPGHTRESLSFELIDAEGAVRAILTGDFLFAGEVGRPDLGARSGDREELERNARELQQALRRLADMPDEVRILPGHTAGSLCGRSICALPQSSLRIERRINGSLRAAGDDGAFLDKVLRGLPDPPAYFVRVKRRNLEGASGELRLPDRLDAECFKHAAAEPANVVIDCRAWSRFCEGFLPGSISAPLDRHFANAAGSYLEQGDAVLLVCEEHELEKAVRILFRVGIDEFAGWTTPAEFDAIPEEAFDADGIEEIGATEAHRRWSGGAAFIDVRLCGEFEVGHLPDAIFAPFSQLPNRLAELPKDRELIAYCRSGGRSARACAYLKRRGYRVSNLRGGYWPWAGRDLPVQSGAPADRLRC